MTDATSPDTAAETVPVAVRGLIDTTNAADTEGFVALFTDEAHVEDYGRAFEGRPGAADWNQSDNIGRNAHFDYVGCEPDPKGGADAFVVTVDVSGDGFTGRSTLHVTVDGEKISRLVIP